MSKKTEHMYDLSGVFGLESVTSVRPGTSILVSGPTMTGKENLALELLADGTQHGEGAVVVTTDRTGEDVLADIESFAPGVDGERLAVIDCRSGSGREQRELDDGAFIYSVSDPSDLTGIGIGITKCFDRMRDNGVTEGRMALTSLSTMVRYADRETVFKFCHVLSSRLDSAGFLGLFTINSGAHEDRTVQVIKQAFDGNVEVRENDGVREARVKGLEPEPSDWMSL
jgi:KaiC/GvpD/RAD55 family RecA-like ATPase